MTKRFILLSFIWLGLLFTSPTSAREILVGPVLADVIRVIDGDTILVRARVWIGQTLETRVRLDGIDTPELRGKCQSEKLLAQKAKSAVISLIGDQTVLLSNIQLGKFAGRVVADVTLQTDQDLRSKLIEAGLGRAYHGGKRESWCP